MNPLGKRASKDLSTFISYSQPIPQPKAINHKNWEKKEFQPHNCNFLGKRGNTRPPKNTPFSSK